MHTLVIFGASGDLTSRKLIPAQYQLFRKGRLPKDMHIVGFSRTSFTDEAWREKLKETTAKFAGKDFNEDAWQKFAPLVHYVPGDLTKAEDYAKLAARLTELEGNKKSTR